jgi:2-C-methyl-D-erythritol 4-phosphate cytidylyltransferase
MGISRHIPPPEPIRVWSPPTVPTTGARDVGVIIVAAGQSTRAGSADGELKQFRWIAGKPMLLHSVHAFLARPDVTSVVCVLPRKYAADPPPWLLQSDLNRLLLSVGGDERTDSVRNGLQDLTTDARVVLVHDAARPFVTAATIERVVASVRAGRCAIAALPVIDTLKEAPSSTIARTIDRRGLWRAQTPQGFPREIIDRAYREAAAAGVTATDDAALVERIGVRVDVVHGSERAMKITEENDFRRAELLAAMDD